MARVFIVTSCGPSMGDDRVVGVFSTLAEARLAARPIARYEQTFCAIDSYALDLVNAGGRREGNAEWDWRTKEVKEVIND